MDSRPRRSAALIVSTGALWHFRPGMADRSGQYDLIDERPLCIYGRQRGEDQCPSNLENFKQAIQAAVDFAERFGPQLMVQTFIDAARMLAVRYQLYRDSNVILEHWRLADPHIAEVMKHCAVIDIQIYGEPNSTVMDRMREMLEDGCATQVPRLSGFVRLTSSD